MTYIEVKTVSPILHCDGIFSLAVLRHYFNVFQYLFGIIFSVHSQKNVSA